MRIFLLMLPLTVLAQTEIPDSPEFARILRDVLGFAKPFPELPFRGYRYTKDLAMPGAGLCSLNDFAYSCAWEAKPNKYSVAVLEQSLTMRVAAAIASSWQRGKSEEAGKRSAIFFDGARQLEIKVTAPVAEGDVVLPMYAVTLTVERRENKKPGLTPAEHFELAGQLLGNRDYQSAANEFRNALTGDSTSKLIAASAHLELGKIFDLTGQRERAINEYRQVQRTGDNSKGAMDEAAKYLASPYRSP